MPFRTNKHIFFDLDHTLWDFEKNSALAFQEIFTNLDISVNLNDFLEVYIPLNKLYWEKYRNEVVTQEELRYGRLRDSFDSLKMSISDADIWTIAHQYITTLPTYNHLFEGAVDVLNYLKTNYSLHIITNGFNEVQTGKLKNSGIMHYFETITNSEMAGVKKPNPKIFEYALRFANAKASQSVMVGDCLEADIYGAKAIGMQTIWFNEFKVTPPKDIIAIHTLGEIKNYL
ncbi:putative hydrolase of the HAD superfamily [Flavobacterium croceum DSM 17960]|uniref:Putative hydrolase of the HAD superfamily n=1 Tax=Flavobacterium croceum DSM 17960 TaxID=1121886 RepID=A0A2S4N9Q0_9FLAO|nr:YjjG family noncanonical pyrimidine nucleotidase [Flavobacterium croceum]POS02422.1 putative hydrolase of the HAD superfamily [Flavobacterium croceum DSM 17960]